MEPEQFPPLGAFNELAKRSVPHILEKIFFALDHKSFKSCMRVNKDWSLLFSTTSYKKRFTELTIEKWKNEMKLVVASADGNIDLVRMLVIDLMVDVDAVMAHDNRCPATPLIEAARNGHIDVVTFLLNAGALVNKPATNGETPLIWAIFNNRLDIMKVLLQAGSMAKGSGYLKPPLHVAVLRSNREMIKLLLDAGADTNETDKYGVTPLNLAATYGHLDIIQTLSYRCNDINHPDTHGRTPLHKAAKRHCKRAARFLLQQGANPYQADKNGVTPMQVVSIQGEQIIKNLVEEGHLEQKRESKTN